MAKLKYGRYVYKNLVKRSSHPEIIAPIFSFKPRKEAGGTNISLEWCYIQQPVVLAKRRKVENLDRFLLFAGGNPLDLGDFKAEIEISLGEKGEVFKFNEPRVVYIPKGLAHYPLTIKKVDRPLVMLDITSTQEYKRDKITDYSKYITTPDIGTHTEVTENGARLGKNTVFLIEIDDITVAHLGDLGQPLTSKQVEDLGNVDVLLLPVGGVDTIDAAHAAGTVRAIEPKIVVPMHYKTLTLTKEIDGVDKFLKEMGITEALPQPKLTVTRSGLPLTATVMLLNP